MRTLGERLRDRGTRFNEKKRVPSLKRALISLNHDLDQSYAKSLPWHDDAPLTDVEFYVLCIEDRRFFSHPGVDLISVLREMLRLVTFRRFGGASTIEMQFIRSATGNYDRTPRRKIREIILAVLLPYHLNKISTLRSYMDIAYFGYGITGVEEASIEMYGRSSATLSPREAAMIASMLLSPIPSNRNNNWLKRVESRANYALDIGARLEKRFKKIGVR